MNAAPSFLRISPLPHLSRKPDREMLSAPLLKCPSAGALPNTSQPSEYIARVSDEAKSLPKSRPGKEAKSVRRISPSNFLYSAPCWKRSSGDGLDTFRAIAGAMESPTGTPATDTSLMPRLSAQLSGSLPVRLLARVDRYL